MAELHLKTKLNIDDVLFDLEVTQVDGGVITGFKFDGRMFKETRFISESDTIHSDTGKQLETRTENKDTIYNSNIANNINNVSKGTETICIKCKQIKPLDSFNKCKANKKTGRQNTCRNCQKKISKEWKEEKLRELSLLDQHLLSDGPTRGRPKKIPFPDEHKETKKDDVSDESQPGKFKSICDYVKKELLDRKPVDFTILTISNMVTLFYKKNYGQTLSDSGQSYAWGILKRLLDENIIERERRKNGGPYFYNILGYRKEKISLASEEPESVAVKKTDFSWNKDRDKILRDNFDELGVSGIFDKSLLPGFSMTDIRKRCMEFKLVDQYGNRTKGMR